MAVDAETAVCPQCGAPLELDEQGHCAWCRAVIRIQPEGSAFQRGTASRAAFFDLCDSGLSLPPPAGALLSGLRMLGKDDRVYQEVSNPAFLTEVRDLTDRVRTASERAADNGLESWPDWLKDYTVEEIWCFRLARDLMVWLATLDGVRSDHRRLALESAEDYEWGKHVRKALDKYGDGPGTLRGLRTRIPLDLPAKNVNPGPKR